MGEVEWDERIVMTTYDWTKISKSLGIEWGKIKLRDHIWFQVGGIDCADLNTIFEVKFSRSF